MHFDRAANDETEEKQELTKQEFRECFSQIVLHTVFKEFTGLMGVHFSASQRRHHSCPRVRHGRLWYLHEHRHYKIFYYNFGFEHISYAAFHYERNEFFEYSFGPKDWCEYDMCY
jgi:hypothetical protein